MFNAFKKMKKAGGDAIKKAADKTADVSPRKKSGKKNKKDAESEHSEHGTSAAEALETAPPSPGHAKENASDKVSAQSAVAHHDDDDAHPPGTKEETAAAPVTSAPAVPARAVATPPPETKAASLAASSSAAAPPSPAPPPDRVATPRPQEAAEAPAPAVAAARTPTPALATSNSGLQGEVNIDVSLSSSGDIDFDTVDNDQALRIPEQPAAVSGAVSEAAAPADSGNGGGDIMMLSTSDSDDGEHSVPVQLAKAPPSETSNAASQREGGSSEQAKTPLSASLKKRETKKKTATAPTADAKKPSKKGNKTVADSTNADKKTTIAPQEKPQTETSGKQRKNRSRSARKHRSHSRDSVGARSSSHRSTNKDDADDGSTHGPSVTRRMEDSTRARPGTLDERPHKKKASAPPSERSAASSRGSSSSGRNRRYDSAKNTNDSKEKDRRLASPRGKASKTARTSSLESSRHSRDDHVSRPRERRSGSHQHRHRQQASYASPPQVPPLTLDYALIMKQCRQDLDRIARKRRGEVSMTATATAPNTPHDLSSNLRSSSAKAHRLPSTPPRRRGASGSNAIASRDASMFTPRTHSWRASPRESARGYDSDDAPHRSRRNSREGRRINYYDDEYDNDDENGSFHNGYYTVNEREGDYFDGHPSRHRGLSYPDHRNSANPRSESVRQRSLSRPTASSAAKTRQRDRYSPSRQPLVQQSPRNGSTQLSPRSPLRYDRRGSESHFRSPPRERSPLSHRSGVAYTPRSYRQGSGRRGGFEPSDDEFAAYSEDDFDARWETTNGDYGSGAVSRRGRSTANHPSAFSRRDRRHSSFSPLRHRDEDWYEHSGRDSEGAESAEDYAVDAQPRTSASRGVSRDASPYRERRRSGAGSGPAPAAVRVPSSAASSTSSLDERDVLREVEVKMDLLAADIMQHDEVVERNMMSSPFERLYHMNNRHEKELRQKKVEQYNKLDAIRKRLANGELAKEIEAERVRAEMRQEYLSNPDNVYNRLYRKRRTDTSGIADSPRSTLNDTGAASSNQQTPRRSASATSATGTGTTKSKKKLSKAERQAMFDRLYLSAVSEKKRKEEMAAAAAHEKELRELEEMVVQRLAARLALNRGLAAQLLTDEQRQARARQQLEDRKRESPETYIKDLSRPETAPQEKLDLLAARLTRQGYIGKEELERRKQQSELRDCTFTPSINPGSARLAAAVAADGVGGRGSSRLGAGGNDDSGSVHRGSSQSAQAAFDDKLYRRARESERRAQALRNDREYQLKKKILDSKMANDYHFRKRVERDPTLADRFMKSLTV